MEESTTDLKALRTSSPIGKIFDFSDAFSPMLVKEIRQGLRSVSFTILFLVAQALLCISIIITLIIGNNIAATGLSYFIFLVQILAVCVFQPLRGTNAINGEIKGNTLDLLAITRLSSWKIVQGKWVSIMAQSLLFTISLLPYLILRYFLGQMELFTELFMFLSVFIVGGVLTAICIGLSAISIAFIRIASIIIVVASSLIALLIYISYLFMGAGMTEVAGELISSPWLLLPICMILLGLIYVAHLAIDFAASVIAPVSENRAFSRRLLFLGILLTGIAANVVLLALYQMTSWSDKEFYIVGQCFVLFMCTAVFTLHVISTSTENTYITTNVARSLKAKRRLGVFRHLFYPGMGSGVWYLSLCILLLLGQFFPTYLTAVQEWGLATRHDNIFQIFIWFTSLIGIMLLPAVFVSFLRNMSVNRLVFYLIGVGILTIISAIVIILIEGVGEGEGSWLFLWLPPMNLTNVSSYSYDDNGFLNVFFGWLTIIGSVIFLFFRSRPDRRQLLAQEKAVTAGNKSSERAELPAPAPDAPADQENA